MQTWDFKKSSWSLETPISMKQNKRKKNKGGFVKKKREK
jgi:hypothetical protein